MNPNVESRVPAIVGGAPFVAVHVIAVAGVVSMGWSWSGMILALGLYYLRMFFVTAGYHRYFSHRSYKTSRGFQFLLGLMAETSAQKGVLWWAVNHRKHHKSSDTPMDVHSPRYGGMWWAHVGWVLSPRHHVCDVGSVSDLARYRELRWLDRYWMMPPVLFAVVCLLLGGWHGLLWGFFVSTVMLWHGTFTINSLAHVIGRRRYATTDDSRNSAILALVTMGEGWHNNHHYYQSSVNQGFLWWEFDLSYYLLRALSATGVVWDLRRPPASVVAGHACQTGAPPQTRDGTDLRDAA